ncbi:Uncharacterised protein [BD1-7 clade bacterium]|uniref:Big-1 domain-containing protein n=1 Tax=BD1-7 clade bacterium TaxID=2029982 RepID=A0A5S9QJX5_9GAMM|nr:Uncharacterised protein [BD1-7 clade bacterium]
MTLTYTADRCFGQDQLTLAGTFNGLAISDNIALTINPVELSINVDDTNLFSGQTANITAQIRNSTGQPVSGDIQLQANSDCVVLNKATLGGSLNGQGTQISFTYENNTCEGNDVVLISGKFNDQTISGDTTIKTSEGVDTQPADEVEVNVITSLQTMESNQTSNITVQAINGQGAPLTGDFALIVNSPCLTIDRSEITGSLSVNAASSLTFTYDPKGCYGNDPLSISGTFNSQPVQAITTVTVNPVSLALNVEDSELLLNETTSITAQIQDSKGQPVSGNISLQVNSDCIVLNKSSVSGALTAQNSNLAFDYTTATCIGSDNISVAGTFDEQPVAATASIQGSEATQGIPSQVTISSNTAVIGAQDEATLNIQILTANNSPASGTFNVELVSACLSAGLANIDGSTETNSGSFEVKYVPFGCSGNDDITARVRNEDETFEATLSLTVNAALPDGLSWIENQPGNSLNILGAGGVQNVKVTFALTASGVPVPQQEVAFSLLDESNSPIPSSIATLLTTSAITDNTGQITVTIKSGTRRGDVKVVATHVTSGTSAESKLIGVRGGFPNDFNISLSTQNPNAWNRTGNDPIQIVEITAFLDDKEGDIIPDGATVLFEQSESYGQFRSSEGSQSDGGSCVIENGTCSVTWVPDGNQPSDGRLTFIAYTKGHERFRDKNDNGLFDSGDDFPVLSSDDLSEPFYDKLKGNGTFAEFNNIKDTDENYKDTLTKNTAATSTGLPAFDGEFTEANGLWDGPLDMCPPENRSRCSGAEATLYASSTFILSDDTPRVCDANGNSPPAYNLNNWIVPIGSSINIPRDLTNDDSQLYLCDINSNVLPKGTVMSWNSTGSGDVVGFIDTTIQNNLLIQPIPSAVYAPTSSNSVSILSVEAVIPQPDSGSLEWAKPFRTPSAYAFYLCDATKNPIAYSPDNFTITPGSGVKEIPRHLATSDVYLCNNIDTALPSGTTFSWKEEGAGVFTGSTLGILSDNTYPTLLPTVNYNVPNAVDTNVDTSGKINLVVVAGNIQYTISLPFDISFIAPTP